MKWLERDQDNLDRKFSSLNVDFSSPSSDSLSSRRHAQVGVKDGYPLKSGYFTTIGWCSVKTVADMQLIITSNTDKLFSGVNTDDLEPSNSVV